MYSLSDATVWGISITLTPDGLERYEEVAGHAYSFLRALGKAGAVDEAMGVFEKMCRTVWLLPEERALNSMYELCVLSGHHAYALRVFDEHEELRKSLWRPRYTPVSFSLLLTACAEPGPDAEERLAKLPRGSRTGVPLAAAVIGGTLGAYLGGLEGKPMMNAALMATPIENVHKPRSQRPKEEDALVHFIREARDGKAAPK